MGQNQSTLSRGDDGQVIYRALRKVNFFGFLWITSLAALGAWIAVMVQDDVPPVEYHEEGARIIPSPVEDGGRVAVEFNVSRNRSCPGIVHRTLRNAETGKVEAIYDPIPAHQGQVSGDTYTKKTFELPEGLPPLVKYQARVCYVCNTWQALVKPLCTGTPDVIFRVVPKGSLTSPGATVFSPAPGPSPKPSPP